MGSARRNTRSSGLSAEPRKREARFVLCVENDDYPASLERHKVYQVIADAQASRRGQMRVIDESGEDYLYPQAYFIPIRLPQAAERAVLKASCGQVSGGYMSRDQCKHGLDERCRDADGEIRRKRSDTLVGTLRREYGEDFAEGFRSDARLGKVLRETKSSSLSDYLKRRR
jgi:hypothetical protein